MIEIKRAIMNLSKSVELPEHPYDDNRFSNIVDMEENIRDTVMNPHEE